MFRGYLPSVVFSLVWPWLLAQTVVAASGQYPQIEKRLARVPLPEEFLPEDEFDQKAENLIGEAQDFELEWVLGVRGSEPSEFLLPTHVEVDGSRIFVTDYGNRRVQQFTLSGQFEKVMPFEKLIQPVQTQYHENRFYVVDRGCPCVRVYDADASYIRDIGGSEEVKGGLNTPNSLVLDDTGLLWVADDSAARVVVYALQKPFGRPSHYFMSVDEYQPETTLRSPRSLSFMQRKSRMLLVDSGTARVLAFDQDGNFEKNVLSWASSKGAEVFMPQALVADPAGGLYVADHIAHRILKYGPNGKALGSLGLAGQVPQHRLLDVEANSKQESGYLRNDDFVVEDSKLKFPMGMAVTDSGDILIADWGHNRVKYFSRSYWSKGVEAYRAGDLILAMEYFHRIREGAEAYHQVEFYLGMCHYYLGDAEAHFEQKQEHFRKARELFEKLELGSKVGRYTDSWIASRAGFYLSRVEALLIER